ncbi:hypothetical protein FAF44_13555 [Nonomuraea sp. MG754425]|uniref:hypothetical protein n=1 Tax=Nonomuraea sp. MG754425 TaxID=2570319 RepID=UPI001F2CAE46|nr:hypothetical protein [Nonomuraea sp. MG754425]MCF6469409.1 hypothetical protein [Nonomuraea sp. MG754425]
MPDAPLLHYSASTAPLQAGSPDNPAANTIDITISSPAGQNIYCDKIDVAVPISEPGDGGAYFTENPQSSIAGKWSPAPAQVKTGRALGLASDANYYHFPFNAPPIPGFDLIDEPLKITITGNLAATPGSVLTCLVTEDSGTTSGHYTRKETQELTWDTAEPVFFLRNFLATAPSEPTIPKTKFNAGDEIYLTWESNGDSYFLYDGDGTILNPDTPSATSHLITSAIANDTTFTLKASKKNATGFETVDRYVTITVTINNPTLSGLTSTGDITAKAGLDVSGLLEVANRMTIGNYPIDGSTNYLSVRGNVDIGGALLVTNGEDGETYLALGGKHMEFHGFLRVNDLLVRGDDGVGKLTTEDSTGLKVVRLEYDNDI